MTPPADAYRALAFRLANQDNVGPRGVPMAILPVPDLDSAVALMTAHLKANCLPGDYRIILQRHDGRWHFVRDERVMMPFGTVR